LGSAGEHLVWAVVEGCLVMPQWSDLSQSWTDLVLPNCPSVRGVIELSLSFLDTMAAAVGLGMSVWQIKMVCDWLLYQ